MKKYFLFLILCICFTMGCGPKGSSLPTQFVEGKVTLDGEPLEKALVTFQPEDSSSGGIAASGYTDKAGIYHLTSMGGDPEKGAVEGKYKITVSKVHVNVISTPSQNPDDDPIETAEQTELMHKNYIDTSSTPLEATVLKGKNKIDFTLSKDGT